MEVWRALKQAIFALLFIGTCFIIAFSLIFGREENKLKIHTMNGKQSHYEQVKCDVIKHGEITIRGWKIRDTIQLLEGSNRMIAAIELGVPITIVLVGDNDIIEHDDDETYSNATQSWEKATALELAASIAYSERRSDYEIYCTEEYPNIKIISQ